MENEIGRSPGGTKRGGYSPWFVLIVSIFVTCLITANIIAVKIVSLGGLMISAAVIIFPLSYVFGDVLTEVYGYRKARQVIWLGFLCNLVAVLAIWLGQLLPAAPFWQGQAAYEKILGYAPRLLAASFLGYLVGEFANSFILAKMKIATKGRWLWTRTIGSTIIGEGLDSLVFMIVAFGGTMPNHILAAATFNQWWLKSLYEVAVTPLTYKAVRFLKRVEQLDTYDHTTRFNPLLITD